MSNIIVKICDRCEWTVPSDNNVPSNCPVPGCKGVMTEGPILSVPPCPPPIPGSAADVLAKLEREKAEMLKSGGAKYDSDKPRMDLLDSYAMEQLAKVLTFGAKKYAAHNWRKGISKSRLIAAALRHIFAYLGGTDTDEETGLSHIAHAMCCCMFLLGLEHRTDLDDRHKENDDVK